MNESYDRRGRFFKQIVGSFIGKLLASILLDWWSGQ